MKRLLIRFTFCAYLVSCWPFQGNAQMLSATDWLVLPLDSLIESPSCGEMALIQGDIALVLDGSFAAKIYHVNWTEKLGMPISTHKLWEQKGKDIDVYAVEHFAWNGDEFLTFDGDHLLRWTENDTVPRRSRLPVPPHTFAGHQGSSSIIRLSQRGESTQFVLPLDPRIVYGMKTNRVKGINRIYKNPIRFQGFEMKVDERNRIRVRSIFVGGTFLHDEGFQEATYDYITPSVIDREEDIVFSSPGSHWIYLFDKTGERVDSLCAQGASMPDSFVNYEICWTRDCARKGRTDSGHYSTLHCDDRQETFFRVYKVPGLNENGEEIRFLQKINLRDKAIVEYQVASNFEISGITEKYIVGKPQRKGDSLKIGLYPYQ
jgi:hypothetical protein